jgi:hypothetical protein
MEKNNGRSTEIFGNSSDMGKMVEFTAKFHPVETRISLESSGEWELDREIIEHWGFMIF